MSESAPKKPREFVDKPVFRLADPENPVMYSTWSNMADGLSGAQGYKPSVLPQKHDDSELTRRLREIGAKLIRDRDASLRKVVNEVTPEEWNAGYDPHIEEADIKFYDALDELKTTWKRMQPDDRKQEYRHIKALYDGLDDLSKKNYAPEMDYLDRTKSAP